MSVSVMTLVHEQCPQAEFRGFEYTASGVTFFFELPAHVKLDAAPEFDLPDGVTVHLTRHIWIGETPPVLR